MNKHLYEIVNAEGDLLIEIISGYTNLDKQKYFEKYLANDTLAGLSKAFGEKAFVAYPRGRYSGS